MLAAIIEMPSLLPELIALVLAMVLLLYGLAFARMLSRRRVAPAALRPVKQVASAPVSPVAAGDSPPLTQATQLTRLYAVIDKATASADRAFEAHVAATRHLDSAEYQLQQLFRELPILMAARAIRVGGIDSGRPPVDRGALAGQAMAA